MPMLDCAETEEMPIPMKYDRGITDERESANTTCGEVIMLSGK